MKFNNMHILGIFWKKNSNYTNIIKKSKKNEYIF